MASQTVLLLAAVLLPLAASAPATGEPFTLMDFVEGKFTTRTFKGTWISDNELRFYNSTTRELIKFDVEQGITTILVPKDILNKYNDSAIDSFSKDGNLVAIAYETVHIYRHSTTSKFVVYDIQSGKEYKVAGEQQLRTLVWAGPRAGQRGLLWVNQQNDVYYRRDVTSATSGDIRITTTGEDGVIFNGIPDWVYEEEVLASGSAIWPSPDGTKVAFASFNDKLVNRAFYFKYGSPTGSYPPQQYPQLVNISYPKAGTPNPEVHLYVVDLEAVVSPTDVKLVPIEAPTEVTRDHILYGCFWTESKLLASWTNRVQNLNVLSSCSMDGKCVEALSQSEVAGWVDPPALMMHSGGRRAAAILPNEDRANLAVITFPSASESGRATWTFLTSGNGNVIQVLDWDEKRDVLYYLQTTPEDPAQRHVYKVVVPGAGNNMLATSPQCLTCNIKTPEGNLCSYATATFSKDFKYSVVSCLGPDPAFHDIYLLTEKEPELKRTWDHNEEVRLLLRNKLRPEYLDDWYSVTVDMRARVRLLLPPGMDKSGKTKYPLLVYVYAGPDSNQVSTAFSVTFGDYLCTSRNIVYALIDGRGSGNNGRKLMHSVYRRLGGVEIQDQISVARKLQQKLPYLDPQRTAIWGWSYGGFSTAHAMAKDTGGVFCCGVSVAPVTSFIYYDTIYTERYMGLPTEADNLYGYNLTDVTRVVDNFRNKKYLLIHGNADDNVHYQQSMELSRALEEKDIMFQQQSYPDEAHSLAGVKKHVYHTMDDFWTRAFHLPKPQWANKAL